MNTFPQSRTSTDLRSGEISASSKLKAFFHKTENNVDTGVAGMSKRFREYQDRTYKNNPAATYTTEINEIKNANPFVEEFVAMRMKVGTKTPNMIRFGSNQTKYFEEDSIVGLSIKESHSEPKKTDSILMVKEQDTKYVEDSFNSGWDENIAIENPIVLEGMLRCWEACGIPDSEFDAEDLVMTVQKLSYGILQALANQGAVNKLVKQIEVAEITEDFEECWLDLLEALQSEEKLMTMETDLSEQFAINKEQRSRNLFLEDRVRFLESQLDDQLLLKRECENSVANAHEAAKLYEDQKSKYHDVCTKINRIELDLEEKTMRNDALLQENGELREDLMRRESHLDTCESQLRRLQRTLSQNQADAERTLERKNYHCNQLIARCESLEKDWKDSYSRVAHECEKLNLQSQNLRLDLQRAKEDVERYKLKTTESLISLHTSKNRIQELETQYKDAFGKMTAASSQLDEMLDFKQKAKARIISLRDSKLEIKKQSKHMQHNESLLRSQLNEIIDQYEVKDAENRKLLIELEQSKRLVQETKELFKGHATPLGHKSLKKHRPLRILTNRIDAC
ncbi:LAME_0G10418g1_1 [Lachancea meyersii CBS 8951]|uniref:LAME_0G10418g1_1 n=1 Tax=Lachancea meyersii CBS 8951 TaxID=1266667 RepID=A0A1G4K942_9SACH|nr:LAME_0G10418g1_1 [Lachancea meyersii CBS 8951]